MSLSIQTSDPAELLKEIKAAIDKKSIETWTYDADGDFTHTSPHWCNDAYLRPTITGNELLLNILGLEEMKLTKETYGIYHGSFIQILLTYFNGKFTSVSATAEKSAGDNFD